jgi:cytoskeletal protein RodZ
MTDIGAKLREARERRGVSLREIADRTKISVAALESLERNDPSRLPGGIFIRSFVKSYAAEVGLDPDATVREFLVRFDLEPIGVQAVQVDAESAAQRAELPQRALGMLLKIVVASLVAMAIILYLTRARHQDDQSSEPRTDSARRTSRRAVSRVVPGLRRLPERVELS